MSVVVDSSVVVASLIDVGRGGAWAEKILEGGALYAPALLQVEVANVLRRIEQAGRIARQEAHAAFEDLMQLDVELQPFEPFSARVWELRRNITSYDAWYVAVAEALDLPLATLDGRLAKAKEARCRFLTPPR